jgi:hypothetical protein
LERQQLSSEREGRANESEGEKDERKELDK